MQNLGGWLTTVVSRVCLDMLGPRPAARPALLDGYAGAVWTVGGGPKVARG